MSRGPWALFVLLALGGLAGPAQARKGPPKLVRQADSHGGRHWRIAVPGKGPIHLWVPAGYHRPTAGLVIYLHGYWSDPDAAWRDHHLPRQFQASRQNAVFIVPASPQGREDSVKWPALKELKAAVRQAGLRLPGGPVVVVAHSGAYRTVERWVEDPSLRQVTLVDGLYGGEEPWERFIATGPGADRHRLVLVGRETHRRSHAFVRRLKGRVLETIPARYEDLPVRHRRARLLYLKSPYGHMALIDGRGALDLFLRLTPLRRLPP